MNCLANRVELLLCGDRQNGIFYLSDLPGISTQGTDKSSDDLQQTFNGVMDSIRLVANRRLLTDIRAAKFGNWNDKVLACGHAGFYKNSFEIDPNLTHWKGVAINSNSSQYSGLFVKTIQFFAITAGTLDIFVYDIATGILVDTITQAVQVGHNIFYVNRNYILPYSTRTLVFVYETTANTPTLTSIHRDCSCTHTTCGFSCGGYGVHGVECDEPTVSANCIVKTNFSYGLSIDFEIKCMLEAFICANVEIFLDAYIELCAMILLENAMNSPRFNHYVRLETDKKIQLISKHEARYKQILQGITAELFSSDNCCFECQKRMYSAYVQMY